MRFVVNAGMLKRGIFGFSGGPAVAKEGATSVFSDSGRFVWSEKPDRRPPVAGRNPENCRRSPFLTSIRG